MMDISNIVLQQAEDAIKRLDANDIVTPEQIADSVLHRVAYWEKPMSAGQTLLFMRLFSPLVQREEVFLGNVLFNAFLSKAFARALAENQLGQAELVANDLENYYFLVQVTSETSEIDKAFRAQIEQNLPNLFFGEQDEAQGIFGELGRMFTFRKSDFEPFPVYVVPEFLSAHLEKAVRKELDKILEPSIFPNRVRTAMACLAFFYGQTSGGSGDAQSFPNFVDHLVNDEKYDELLGIDEVRRAFNTSDANKPAIKQSIDSASYSTEALRVLLSKLARSFQTNIDNGSRKWLMGFLHKDKKFVDLSQTDYTSALLEDVQLGYQLFPKLGLGKPVPCRLCGAARGSIEERYVTTGINSFRFDNQSVRRQTEKVCVKCALYSYLAQKLLGTEMVAAGGKLPQVPKTCNLVFHYGKHEDTELERLAFSIDLIQSLVLQHRNAEQIRRSVGKQAKDLRTKYNREKDATKRQTLGNDLILKETEFQQAQNAVTKIEEDITTKFPWLKELGSSPIPTENCFLDTLANTQSSNLETERHVLGLGMGGYRMVLLVLPQIRAPRDAKEHDFAQRQFADSRVAVSALLAFLRELCGCDGPFYYQSLPTLAPNAFDRNTFYIRNERVTVKQAQKEYEAVTQLAWKLVRKRGPEGLVEKVVLAEKLLKEPLGAFASVMRDSKILGQTDDKYKYKRLPSNYRSDWMAWDLTEYAKFIQRLTKL